MDNLMTPQQVGKALNVSDKRVKEWAKDGKMPAVVLPNGRFRFNPSIVQSWILARTTKVLKPLKTA